MASCAGASGAGIPAPLTVSTPASAATFRARIRAEARNVVFMWVLTASSALVLTPNAREPRRVPSGVERPTVAAKGSMVTRVRAPLRRHDEDVAGGDFAHDNVPRGRAEDVLVPVRAHAELRAGPDSRSHGRVKQAGLRLGGLTKPDDSDRRQARLDRRLDRERLIRLAAARGDAELPEARNGVSVGRVEGVIQEREEALL